MMDNNSIKANKENDNYKSGGDIRYDISEATNDVHIPPVDKNSPIVKKADEAIKRRLGKMAMNGELPEKYAEIYIKYAEGYDGEPNADDNTRSTR